LKKEKGFSFTLLAHHADDNIETLLMNFFRGTGLHGLTAMPDENLDEKFFLRPLLEVRRKEIIEFAKQNNLQWEEDSSNASSKYTRNFFRNELLPAIKKVYPQVEENLLGNIERFKKTNALYQTSVEELKKKVCEQYASEVRIPILKLMKHQETSLIYEIIKDYGFGEKQVEEVIKLATAESGRFIENDQYQIIKHRNWFIIAPKASIADTIAIEKETAEVFFSNGKLELKIISKEKFHLQKKENIAQLDVKHIEYPLVLRKWRQGDYFYPLGMRKKKKLARFFIDQKLPKNQKENIWVLESNKKIIWIVGMRIDDRFKIINSTKEILLISVTSP
jgi:tRNA(Ile)-lysidine synthase